MMEHPYIVLFYSSKSQIIRDVHVMAKSENEAKEKASRILGDNSFKVFKVLLY